MYSDIFDYLVYQICQFDDMLYIVKHCLSVKNFNTATSSKYNNLTAYGSVYYSILVAYVKDQFHECVKKKPKDRDKFLIILKS